MSYPYDELASEVHVEVFLDVRAGHFHHETGADEKAEIATPVIQKQREV